jgi:hypothetical protein
MLSRPDEAAMRAVRRIQFGQAEASDRLPLPARVALIALLALLSWLPIIAGLRHVYG